MNAAPDIRDRLYEQAAAVEVETRAGIRAARLRILIDDTLVPHIGDDEQLRLFLPIQIALDAQGRPAEFPDGCATLIDGAVACLGERAVFGWITGSLRSRRWQYALPYANVRDASVQILRMKSGRPDRYGVDIEDRSTWSLLLSERIHTSVAEEYADALVRQLSDGRRRP